LEIVTQGDIVGAYDVSLGSNLQLSQARQWEAGTTEFTKVTEWHAPQRLIVSYERLDATLRSPLPTWSAAEKLIQNWQAMSEVESRHLVQIYRESKQRLSPLSDPLDVRFPLQRQLSSSREEVFSDWFQWVLQQVSDARLIGRILGSTELERLGNSQGPIRVDREVRVEHGHTDQSGRLDLVVKQGSRCLAVIEVKTRTYEEADLGKHKGYRESISSPGTDFIFLAVESTGLDLGGFRFLSWADVCVALRRIAPHILDPEHILGTALILAFVGAVEQNLLGFVAPEPAPPPIGKVPRMVRHLMKARIEVNRG